MSQVTRVEWPEGQELIVIAPEVASPMIRLGFAVQPDDTLIEEYNDAVEAYLVHEADEMAAQVAKQEADAKAAADKAAADKAATDKIVADKAAADKAAADKAAADKAAADKIVADKATADAAAAAAAKKAK